jgi:HEAT repeat protein
MSADRSDERPPDSPQLPAESPVTSASHGRVILQSILALLGGGVVLWWITQTVLSDGHSAKKAIREMESNNPSVRVSAIRELQTVGLGKGEITIPPLIVALRDENAQARSAAAVALGAIGADAVNAGSLDDLARRAIAALLDALKDPQPAGRVAAANALASMLGSTKAAVLVDSKATVAALTECMKDPDAEFRYAALRVLALAAANSRMGPPHELAGALKDERAGNRSVAAVAVVNFARGLDPWVPSLFQIIETDDDLQVREAVATRVATIHPPAITAAAIPELIAALERTDGRARGTAARVLMSFGPEGRMAIPALIAMARESWSDSADVERRRLQLDGLAIQALTKIALETDSAGRVITALTELLQEKSPKRCAMAVDALGEFGPAAQSVIPALIRALPWRLPPVTAHPFAEQAVVIKALGRIAPGTKPSAELIAGLGGAMRTGQPDLQADAADALAEIGPAAESTVPDLIRAIVEAAREKRPRVTWRASVALGRIAPGTKSASEAIAALHKLLQIPEPDFQIAAADALGDFGPAAEPAVPDLLQIVKKPSSEPADAQVMSSAAKALVRIAPGTPSSDEAMRGLTAAIPQLREIANDKGRPVAGKAARETLAKIESHK